VSNRLGKPTKRVVKLLLFALVVHVFVIPQIGGARKALDVLSSVNPVLLALAVVLEGMSLLAYARMTQLLLPKEHRPGIGVMYGTVVASTGVSHVVPGAAATTAGVNYRLLGAAGVPADQLGFALGAQAIGSAVVLNVLLWLALLASIPASGFQPVYATAAGVGAVMIAGFAVVVVSMLRGRETLADRVSAVLGRIPRVKEQSVRRVMLSLADQLRALQRDHRRLRVVSGMAAANWLLDAAALWVALAAFGSTPSVIGLMVAYGLANVIAAVPISPGGLGVIEAILIPTLVGFGTPRAVASIGVVVYRLVNFWLPIPVGAAAYVAVERITASAPGRTSTAEGSTGQANR
jgi:uncharacterized protein (TIRG00374 family)